MSTLDDRVPVWRTMLVFIVPLLLSSISQTISGTAISIYLARLIGMHAFAASATMIPVLYLLVSLSIGIASGSTVLVGQAHGAGDQTGVQRAAGTSLIFALVGGIAIGGLALVFERQIFHIIGTPPDIIPDAIVYARVLFATMPLLFVFIVYSYLLRGLGDSKTPLVIMLLNEVIFIGSTPLLILGSFGLPRLGIVGAAVANAAALAISLSAFWIWLALRKSPIALMRVVPHLWPEPALLSKLVRIGIPTAAQMMMVSLGEVAVLTFVNRFGSQATEAFGAVNQLLTYIQFPANCLGAAAAVYGAQSIGARRFDRLPKIARAGFALNLVVAGGAIALCYLFARPLLSLFITQPDTLDVAQVLLYIALWSYVIFGNTSVLSGLMRANGTVLWPTAIGILAIWAVQVPIAGLLSHGGLGLRGIWVAYPVAFSCAFIAVLVYYRRAWTPRLAAVESRPA